MNRNRFVVVACIALAALTAGACNQKHQGLISSIVAPTTVSMPDQSIQDFQLVSNKFFPDSGTTLHAQTQWAMKQQSWCPSGMRVGPVFIRDDEKMLVANTAKICDGGPYYMDFQINGVVDDRIMNFSAGHQVVVKVATATSPSEWDAGHVTFRSAEEVLWTIQ